MNSATKFFLAALICLTASINPTAAQTIKILESGRPTSIRGLSVVDDRVAWVSGSNGHIGLSVNGGQTWQWQQVKGYEKSDFRDLEAFSATEAITMSSGTPALILKTIDGGLNWKECYRSDDKAYFLDGMAFTDAKHGYTFGDPINGKFVLLATKNGGDTWEPQDGPDAMSEEAAFAASGTSITTMKNELAIVTGGPVTRLITGLPNHWAYNKLPIAHGVNSKGAFGIANGAGSTMIVGGDYRADSHRDSTACFANNRQKVYDFRQSATMPAGFQSCVAWLNKGEFLSTGTSGTNISVDGGTHWRPIDGSDFNVCAKAKHGKLVLLAGAKGKIARYEVYLPHN